MYAAAWRDGCAIGVTIKQTIRMSRRLVRAAMAHIESLRSFLNADLASRRLDVYAEFKEAFAKGERWEPAPIRLPDRADSSRRPL